MPCFGQGLAGPVEHGGRLAALLLVERRLVADPGAADVDQAQLLGVADHAVDVVAQPVVGEMAADRHEPALVEFRFLNSAGAESAQAGHLDVLEAPLLDLVEHGRHALLAQHVAQAVQLQAGGPVVALALADALRRPTRCRCHGGREQRGNPRGRKVNAWKSISSRNREDDSWWLRERSQPRAGSRGNRPGSPRSRSIRSPPPRRSVAAARWLPGADLGMMNSWYPWKPHEPAHAILRSHPCPR